MADETAAAKAAEGSLENTPGGEPEQQPAQGRQAGEGKEKETFERSLLTKDIETDPPAAAEEGGGRETHAALGASQGSSKCSPGGKQEAPSEPGAPEKYELTMPEGWTLDEEGLAELTPIMRGLKATNEQAQAVADLYIKRLSAAREAQLEADRVQLAAWEKEIREDPEIGGAELKENLATVSRVLAKYAGPEFVAYLDRSNLGNYPPFVKAMVKMAKDLSDDRFIPGGRGGSGGDPVKEAAELIYGKLS
ncbi:hypothetical protein [Synergistes jonesii]|uniref:Uncharacterized protein n=1 Tax=Synergistes jonesii TaxID=2754 RepID=A0A073J6H7_9BACT|nr:hypothetical protein [Synergistes jonesii]KEJ93332.1 hypothetical protein EH55_08490 [Synergistes jonesii]